MLFFVLFGSLADAGGSGIGQFRPFLTSQVVSFSLYRKDPQSHCQAVLPTIYRQEHPHFIRIAAYHAPIMPGQQLLGLGIVSLCIQTYWINYLESSCPLYSTVYFYYLYS